MTERDNETMTWNSSGNAVLTIREPASNFVIRCGAEGSVSIDLKTGSVEIEGLTVDAAAREFWAAVERLAPSLALGEENRRLRETIKRLVHPSRDEWRVTWREDTDVSDIVDWLLGPASEANIKDFLK